MFESGTQKFIGIMRNDWCFQLLPCEEKEIPAEMFSLASASKITASSWLLTVRDPKPGLLQTDSDPCPLTSLVPCRLEHL